jgi:small redox-active disulfide protein 2
MTKIQVLGPGCQKCQVLYQHVEQTVKELGLECELEKVTDMAAIVSFGVMSTPALVVNGEVKFAGRVPTAQQLKEVLS